MSKLKIIFTILFLFTSFAVVSAQDDQDDDMPPPPNQQRQTESFARTRFDAGTDQPNS